MNLPELITKLLLIERQLIEDGIEVNTIKVSYFNEYCNPIVKELLVNIDKNLIEIV